MKTNRGELALALQNGKSEKAFSVTNAAGFECLACLNRVHFVSFRFVAGVIAFARSL